MTELCVLSFNKKGDTVTENPKLGPACSLFSVEESTIQFTGNSFAVQLTYHEKTNSQSEIKEIIETTRDNMIQWRTGSWFRRKP